jgi:hypothetical protein
MRIWRIRSLRVLIALAAALWCSPARAIVLGSGGNGNLTDSSLLSYGGPGDPTLPGFDNVGLSGTFGASVTYLANGWFITANHVSFTAMSNTVTFGANSYTVDLSSLHVLTNPDSSGADLKMYHLTTSPSLPSITGSSIATSTPSGRVIMVGNGLSATGPQQYWDVEPVPMSMPTTYTWTPTTPALSNASGFNIDNTHVIRWGENNITTTNKIVTNSGGITNTFVTTLDNAYISTTPLTYEAGVTPGDSGGGVFSFVGSQWVLSGIMIDEGVYTNQPSAIVYGDEGYIADLSQYRSQILAIIPEPSSTVLALSAAAILALFCGRRRLSAG